LPWPRRAPGIELKHLELPTGVHARNLPLPSSVLQLGTQRRHGRDWFAGVATGLPYRGYAFGPGGSPRFRAQLPPTTRKPDWWLSDG
jgi:hypothetical protein